MGLFDGVQNAMFDAITTTFGDSATWTPLNNPNAPKTADVLFKSASEVAQFFGVEYQPENVYIEFKRSAFDGLKEAVDAKSPEPVIYKGVNYWVKNVLAKWDGNILVAELVID
jgi:hypothetical protein